MQIIEEQSRQKNVWISTTGYRIFLELKLMLEAPRSSDELIEIIKQDRHLNKEVSKDCALYFNKEEDSLKEQIEKCEKFKMKEINEYGEKAKMRIKENYTWESVIKKYKKMFNKIT